MRCFPEVNCESAFRILLNQAYHSASMTKRKINELETYYDLCTTHPNEQQQESNSICYGGTCSMACAEKKVLTCVLYQGYTKGI